MPKKRKHTTHKNPPKTKRLKKKDRAPHKLIQDHLNLLLSSEKHLEKFLSNNWSTTRERHANIAYDPLTQRTRDQDGDEKSHSASPIGFLPLKKEKQTDGEQKNPKAVKASLHQDLKDQELAVGSQILCPGDIKFVDMRFSEQDHFEAKNTLINQVLPRLIQHLNKDKETAEKILEKEKFKPFFIKTKFAGEKKEKIYGTKLLYDLAWNYLGNLWLLCSACNKSKSSKDSLEWLKKNPTFGDYFIKRLKKEKIINKKGEILESEKIIPEAFKWVQDKYGHYISRVKTFLEKISQPIQEELKEAKETSDPKKQEQRYRIADTQINIMASIAAPGMIPKIEEKMSKFSPKEQQKVPQTLKESQDELSVGVLDFSVQIARKTLQKDTPYVRIMEKFNEGVEKPFKQQSGKLIPIPENKSKDSKKSSPKNIELDAHALEMQLSIAKNLFNKETAKSIRTEIGKHPSDQTEKVIKMLEKDDELTQLLADRIQKAYNKVEKQDKNVQQLLPVGQNS